MSTKSVVFDGRIHASTGVGVSHSRPWATANRSGQAVAANDPVYEEPVLVTPVPELVVVDDTASTRHRPHTAGRWVDGLTPAIVHERRTSQFRINIHVGTAVSSLSFKSNPARSKDILCANGDALNPSNWKTGSADLLRGSGAGAGESGSWRLEPHKFLVAEGMVLAACEAIAQNGGSPQSQEVALCIWDEANSRWALVARTTDAADLGTGRGATWMLQDVWVNAAKTVAYIPMVDYRANGGAGATGGMVYLVRATRTAVGQAWTLGAFQKVIEFGGGSYAHIHNAVAYEQTDGRLVLVVCGGDGKSQRLVLITRADGSTYTQGPAAASPVTDDVSTSNGWTSYSAACGDIYSVPRKPSNQYVGIAKTTSVGEYIVGSDETGVSHARMLVPNLTGSTTFEQARVVFENIPGSREAGTNNQGFNSFELTTPFGDGQGPFIGRTQADSAGAWVGGTAAARLLWSPDGRHFSQLWAFNQGESAQGRCVAYNDGTANWAIYGSTSNNKLVAVRIPTRYFTRQPLIVAGAVVNYLDSSIAASNSVFGADTTGGAGVSEQSMNSFALAPNLSTLVPGRSIPPPPNGGQVVRLSWNASSGFGNAALIRLTQPIVPNSARVRISGWIYALPPANPDSGSTVVFNGGAPQLRMKGWVQNGGGPNSNANVIDIQPATGTGWVPFDIDLNVPSSAWSAAPSNPFSLWLQIFQNIGSAADLTAQAILVSFDSVRSGSVDPPVLPPPRGTTQQTCDPAMVEIAGFACSAAWTAEADFVVPRTGPDEYTANRPSGLVLCTFRQSPTRYVSATADATNNRIRFTVVDGASTTNIDVTAVAGEEFNFDRGSVIQLKVSRSGQTYLCGASVGNAQFNSLSQVIAAADVRPNGWTTGDVNGANTEPTSVLNVRVNELEALDATGMGNAARTMPAMGIPSSGGAPRSIGIAI